MSDEARWPTIGENFQSEATTHCFCGPGCSDIIASTRKCKFFCKATFPIQSPLHYAIITRKDFNSVDLNYSG